MGTQAEVLKLFRNAVLKGMRSPAPDLSLGFTPKAFSQIWHGCEAENVYFTLPRFMKINISFNISSWQNVVTYLESNEDSTLKACVGWDGWIAVSQVTEYDGHKERSKYFRREPCLEKVRFCLRGIINFFFYWTDSKTKFEAIFFMIYTWVYYASTEGKKYERHIILSLNRRLVIPGKVLRGRNISSDEKKQVLSCDLKPNLLCRTEYWTISSKYHGDA